MLHTTASRLLCGLTLFLFAVPAVRADVTLWGRSGFWNLNSFPSGGITCDTTGEGTFWEFAEITERGLVTGVRTAGLIPSREDGNFTGTLRRDGFVVKGEIFVPGCGDGKIKLVLDDDLSKFKGLVKFKRPDRGGAQKGKIGGVYFPTGEERSVVELALAFSAKRSGAISPNKNAVLAAFILNEGEPLPIFELNDGSEMALAELQIDFSEPVFVKKVEYLRVDFKPNVIFERDVRTSQLRIPLAVPDALGVAVKFVPSDLLAKQTLRATGTVVNLVADQVAMRVNAATDSDEIPVLPLPLQMKLKNKDDDNIHIFLEGQPDFSKKTRVGPDSSKKLVLGASVGEVFSFAAGRAGVTIARCDTSPVARAGRGNVVWDPKKAPFPAAALLCP